MYMTAQDYYNFIDEYKPTLFEELCDSSNPNALEQYSVQQAALYNNSIAQLVSGGMHEPEAREVANKLYFQPEPGYEDGYSVVHASKEEEFQHPFEGMIELNEMINEALVGKEITHKK